MSEQATIDLARFQELKLSFFTKLSGEKVLTFDIIDQSGAVVFEAGIAIDQNEVVAKSQQGCRFFMPKVVESYGHEIVSRPAIQKLADETREIYSSVRATGAMSYEQFLQSNAHLHSIIDGLRQEDRLGGCLGLLRDMEDFDYYTYAHSANLASWRWCSPTSSDTTRPACGTWPWPAICTTSGSWACSGRCCRKRGG